MLRRLNNFPLLCIAAQAAIKGLRQGGKCCPNRAKIYDNFLSFIFDIMISKIQKIKELSFNVVNTSNPPDFSGGFLFAKSFLLDTRCDMMCLRGEENE